MLHKGGITVIKLCKYNQNNVLRQIREGKLDSIALSTSNLIDEIVLKMNESHILDCLANNIDDLRYHNTTVPYYLIWTSAIAAKMKVKTSLSDVPYAIDDHRTLAKLGYTIIDSDKNLRKGLMQESTLRFLLNKYSPDLFVNGYNNTVQKGVMPLLDIKPDIHILDCTDIEVNLNNEKYEGSGLGVGKKDNKPVRGYKLATLRGIVEDTGIIEEIRFGSISVHDFALSEEMLRTSPVLKQGDILINDRGFISRELINYLKLKRGVDSYLPVRENMEIYEEAVYTAKENDKWLKHPNKKRMNQYISHVGNMGTHWKGTDPDNNVPINTCVLWDKNEDAYHVFITTDMSVDAKDIILTYELRPEIEEDYRQLKDFWKIDDFKSTKINIILFHIVCVLFGYLFFQLYTLLPEGEKYLHKSLPIIIKNYMPEVHPYVVLYVENEFGVLTLLELMELYAQCEENVKEQFRAVLKA